MIWCFRAKVHHVIDCRSVDLIFDLGFSIKKKEKVVLTDYHVPDHLIQEAKDTLVVLIGGHRTIVRIDKNEQENIWTARIYLYQPINLDNVQEVILDRKLPCANRVMREMEKFDYNADHLKTLRNQGKPIPEEKEE